MRAQEAACAHCSVSQTATRRTGQREGRRPPPAAPLQRTLEPLLAGIESLSEPIRECNERIERLAQESYPHVARLKQVKGVGTLIALTSLLTQGDAQRFRKRRDVGCYPELQPGRRNSGQSAPQMDISKKAIRICERCWWQGAHQILGPFGADTDLRRWGLKLAEGGGKNGKKRAVIATARKLAVVGGPAASLVGKRSSLRTAAQQRSESDAGRRISQNHS